MDKTNIWVCHKKVDFIMLGIAFFFLKKIIFSQNYITALRMPSHYVHWQNLEKP